MIATHTSFVSLFQSFKYSPFISLNYNTSYPHFLQNYHFFDKDDEGAPQSFHDFGDALIPLHNFISHATTTVPVPP